MSGKSKHKNEDFSIEIKVQGQRSNWVSDEKRKSPKIISELGSASDLMVKNTLIEDRLSPNSKNRRIPAIPEFEEIPLKFKGESKKAQYRRDRMKEYGQKLKTLGSHERKKRTKVDAQEFLNNL